MDEYIMTLVWAVVFVLAMYLEAQTAEMVALWFMPGALISLVLSFFDISQTIQIIVFVAISAILLVLAKTVFKKQLARLYSKQKTDTDLLIGSLARVEEEIVNTESRGTVKINGQIWSARMEDNDVTASVGESVTVTSISGVKLICKKH